MSEMLTRRVRSFRLVVLAGVLSCVAAAGGVAAWLLLGSDGEKGTCASLLANKRVHEALGNGHKTDMDCSQLGEAIKKATIGGAPGQHTLQQAQAMKDVLLAVEASLKDADGVLDPALRVPLAESLADYAADSHVILGIGNADYVRNGLSSEPAWEDGSGVHMAVPRTWLLQTIRALSEEPTAYVTLRKATTQYSAEGLAAVQPGTTGAQLTAPPMRNARALGALDAVAADVRRSLSEKKAAQWERDVFEELTVNTPASAAYGKDPVGHIVDSWRRTLLANGLESSSTTFEEQSADMVDIWGKALRLDSKLRNSLRQDSLNDSYHARSESLREFS